MTNPSEWYIAKSDTGHCQVVTAEALAQGQFQETWGPFESQGAAIAKRVGLIRAGKCQPN